MPLLPEKLGGEGGFDKLRMAGWQGGPFVTLSFGTRGFAKRWFPEIPQWGGFARIAMEHGIGVVWLGGPEEVALGNRLAAEVPGSWNLTGQTSIPEACAIQSRAWGNVAVDTGLAHTAAATGRPTVTVNGLSPDQLMNPLGPFALTVRGPCIDVSGARTTLGAEETQSTAHRVYPLRVWNLLFGLVMESEGRPLNVAQTAGAREHS
jgi:hypothetical protein